MDTQYDVVLPSGVVRNDSPYAIKGRYFDSLFARFWRGRPQKWKGWANYLGITTGDEPGRGGLIWNAFDGVTLSTYGTASKLWLLKEGVRYDITPQGYNPGLVDLAPSDIGYGDGGYGDGPYGGEWSAAAGDTGFPRVWTFGRWGQDMVACPRGEPIYTWIYGAGDTLGITTTVDSFPPAVILLHFDGTDASTTITDNHTSGSPHTWTAHGNAQLDTAAFKFGTASLLLDGTGDWVDTPDHADFTLGSGNWTFDVWPSCTKTGGSAIGLAGQCDSSASNASTSIRIRRTAANVIEATACVGSTAYTITGTTTFTDVLHTGFHHIAFVRNGDQLKLFVDGVQEGSTVAITGAINDSSNSWTVGRFGEQTGNEWQGWIDEPRLMVGIARWFNTFTPPTKPAQLTTVVQVADATGITTGMRATAVGIPDDTFVSTVLGDLMTLTQAPTSALGDVAIQFDMPAVPIGSFNATGTGSPDPLVPTSVLAIFVTEDRTLVALGAAQGGDSYDPLNVAFSSREDYTVWTPTSLNTAGAIRCESGNRIMGATKVFGGWLILTDLSAHPFTFAGGDDVFSLDRLGTLSGAIGPQAMTSMDGIAYWMGFSQMYRYNGRVEPMPCDVQRYVFDRIDKDRSYKFYASTNAQYGEVILFYTVNGESSRENSAYVAVAINEPNQPWSIGDGISRTTWIDVNPLSKNPIGLGGDTFLIYNHEVGTTADGMPFSYLLETGELELRSPGAPQAGDVYLRLKKYVSDYAYVSGDHSLTIEARGYPHETPVTKGPYPLVASGRARMFNPKARGKSFRYIMAGTGDFRLGDQQVYGRPDGARA